MNLGDTINNLVLAHVELWHRTSRARIRKDLPAEERVALFMRTRELNVLRAQERDKINLELDSGYPDPKINYKE